MPDILEGLLDRPKELKPLLDAHADVVREIKRDKRFTNSHKQTLINESRKVYDDGLKTFVGNFETVCQQKRVTLESMANPPPENNGHSEAMPDSLVLSSEKAMWQSLSESKAVMVQILRNQELALHRDDIELMTAAEIAKAHQSPDTDELLRDAIEVYGSRRIRRISTGSSADVEAGLMLTRLISERRESLKTPNQKQAEADIERLDAIHSKFHLLLGLLGKNKKLVK